MFKSKRSLAVGNHEVTVFYKSHELLREREHEKDSQTLKWCFNVKGINHLGRLK